MFSFRRRWSKQADAAEYASHGRRIANDGGAKATEGVKGNGDLQGMVYLRLGNFCTGRSMQDDIWDPINVLIDDAQRDQEFRQWWTEIDEWIEKDTLSSQPRAIAAGTNPTTQQVPGGQSSPNAQSAVRGKHGEHFDNCVIDSQFTTFATDYALPRFGTDIQRLTENLLFDLEGKPMFKPELCQDKHYSWPHPKDWCYPIPRIEYTNNSLDLVLENLTMSTQNLFPNLVEVEVRNWARFGSGTVTRKKETSKDIATNKHSLHLHLSQIQTDMRDVAFYFRKKSGLPKSKDSGVLLEGNNSPRSSSDPTTLYDMKNITVKVDTLKFAIRDSQARFVVQDSQTSCHRSDQEAIQKAVADGMRPGLEWLGEELIAVCDRLNEAREGATEEKEVGRFKAMQEVFKRRKDDASSTVPRSGSFSQFQVVSNKCNSLLATSGHPSG
ncbi:hypothetical protein DFH05DRAFT_1617521 [Lentinula detonsa]|uniref:Uncharacterized protein n=1 Tax=Lentinula detonsa TaxID=2804962 RepID=A0A9W8P0F5_9AGAR|nr:hypothetical protein DFH05DRAFT_1617521 [Lentinula detonsa]